MTVNIHRVILLPISNNNKNQLIRLQDRLRNLDSRASLTDLNRASRTGLKLNLSPVLGRTFLRGVLTQSSSPPLNMPRLPQSSESQPFPLPILPGGRLAHLVEQWGELTQLSIVRDGFRIPFNSTPSSVSSDKSELIFLPVITRRNSGTSPETGSVKGTRSGNFWFLFPAVSCPEKEWKVTSCNRSFSTKSVHKETTTQDGDSQASTTVDTGQLGCLHRSDRCLSTRSDSSSIQEVHSVLVRRSGLLIHGLTFRNVPVRGFSPN